MKTHMRKKDEIIYLNRFGVFFSALLLKENVWKPSENTILDEIPLK